METKVSEGGAVMVRILKTASLLAPALVVWLALPPAASAQTVSFVGAAREIEVGTDPSSAAVGDFYGDGVPDLATANAGQCR